MAESDWSYLNDGLDIATVDRGVTAGIPWSACRVPSTLDGCQFATGRALRRWEGEDKHETQNGDKQDVRCGAGSN